MNDSRNEGASWTLTCALLVNHVSKVATIAAIVFGFSVGWAEEYFKPLEQMRLTQNEVEWIQKHAPLLIGWAEEVQEESFALGRKLSESEIELARSMSVSDPESIRVLVTRDFPVPINTDLNQVFRTYGIDSSSVDGMVIGYLVFIKPDYEDDIHLLAHEFVHVSQVESLGLKPFLVTYLAELKMYVYWGAPLETEARVRSWRFNSGDQQL